jgi:hypothetical protein
VAGGGLSEVFESPFSSALGVEEAAVANCASARLHAFEQSPSWL